MFSKTPRVRLGVADIWTFAQTLLWRADDYLAFVWLRQQNHIHNEEARGRVNGVWEAPQHGTPLISKHWTGDPGTQRAVRDQKNPAGRVNSTSLVLWSACGQAK